MSTQGVKAAIAGGSIGGLCAGNVLLSLGADVHIYERSTHRLSSRGAGIVVQPELVHLIEEVGAGPLANTGCSIRRNLSGRSGQVREMAMPQRFTSWEAIFESLRSAFPDERYHLGAEVSDPSTKSDSARFTVDGGQETVDILIAADGFRSQLRQVFAPDTKSHYAGYVAWRGVIEEQALSEALATHFDDAFTFCHLPDGGHALAYFIPGDGLVTSAGSRRLNWVWYINVSEGAELSELLIDNDGQAHEAAVPPGLANSRSIANLHEMAKQLDPHFEEIVLATSQPFIQAIVDVAPSLMVKGRACLLGDAAFVVRPHTAGASSKAAGDALALGTSLQGRAGDIGAALRDWESRRLAYGQGLLGYGIRLGERTRVRSV